MSAAMQPHRGPVMSDVAARAGVSHQTVSRVLN
ncbi:LacI family DNA-binding transcriptional regulator, partial [Paractinoplanes toevensis]